MSSYEKIAQDVRDVAGTALPALLTVVVEQCIRKKCFVPGGIQRTIANIERRLSPGTHNESLRENGSFAEKVDLTCETCHAQYRLPTSDIHRACGLNGCTGRVHLL